MQSHEPYLRAAVRPDTCPSTGSPCPSRCGSRSCPSRSRVYPNGLSTSLPRDVQDAFLHTIPGLERAAVLQYGYAVEYDYAPPTQLAPR